MHSGGFINEFKCVMEEFGMSMLLPTYVTLPASRSQIVSWDVLGPLTGLLPVCLAGWLIDSMAACLSA